LVRGRPLRVASPEALAVTLQPQPILIRGGNVVDGTGAPAFRAEVRVEAGAIREVAPSLARRAGERVVDASGCSVAPGPRAHSPIP
jgi:hypothetical protein